MFDVAVIGAGIIGSAAARYLAEAGQRVLLIGPAEPADHAQHDGVFASHYDSGRLIRHSERNIVWARLADRAMKLYPTLEQRSGMRFYTPVGALTITPAQNADDAKSSVRHEIEREFGPRFRRIDDPRELATLYPELVLPGGTFATYQGPPAGHIDPRRLIAAQQKLAVAAGAVLERAIVTRCTPSSERVTMTTRDGATYTASHVLVTVGSFAACFDLLPQRPNIYVKNELVTLAEVSAADGARLSRLPTLSYDIAGAPIADIYMVPPVQFPDGRWYFKLGSNASSDRELTDLGAIQAWMRGDTQADAGDIAAQADVLRSLFPAVPFLSFTSKPCVIFRTPSRLPVVDQQHPRLAAILACNGTSAMSGDSIAADAVAALLPRLV